MSPSATQRLQSIASQLPKEDHNMSALFSEVPLAPVDPIFKLTYSYKSDTFPQKVNLGAGAYRDNEGQPWILPVVSKAKKLIAEDPAVDHEYLPITGLPEFTSASTKLMYGADSPIFAEKRVSAIQTISGTGANHLGAQFLEKFYAPWQKGAEKAIYISNPTWANHKAIFNNLGITAKEYKYYDPKTVGLDFDGFLGAVKEAPAQSVILLHGCAHNPTGIDPTREQWQQLSQVFLEKKHFAFFDCAYQGFASGDLDNDAWAVRHFVSQRIPLLVCQSFAKNAGLYGERIGCLSFVSSTTEEAERVGSQLAIFQRSEISNPPSFGARIVARILNDPQLFEEWKADIKTMAYRIIEMRKALYELLTKKYQTPGKWDHIITQIGMFSFTGLTPEQSKAMVEKAHVYMTQNGRISMAGITTHNVDYVAQSIDKAVRGQL